MGGPRYLRALRGPLPDVPFMPSGGIDLDNIPHYFAAGAYAVGVGGELVDEALLTAGATASWSSVPASSWPPPVSPATPKN